MKPFLLVLGLLITIYLGVYLYFATIFYSARSEFAQAKATAEHIKFSSAETGKSYFSLPSFWVVSANNQVGEVKESNLHLRNDLKLQQLALESALAQLHNDNTELERQIVWLSLKPLEMEEISLPATHTNLDLKYLAGLYDSQQKFNDRILAAKSEINDYTKLQAKAGKFANPLWGKTDGELAELVANMTVSQKAGQLLMVGINGYSLSNSDKQMLGQVLPGGVILMGYNISGSSQTTDLTKVLQQQNNQVPMLIATDQEGGVVKRVSWDSTVGEKQWAGLSDQQMCDLGTQRSKLLLSLGININLTPVVDLTSSDNGAFINNRTISNSPQTVLAKATQFVNCSQATGLITTIKHYPGHGSTSQDSHTKLPVISKAKNDWLASDALPFLQLKQAKMLMVGHLLYKNLDPNNAASQSSILINDILRNEFGYQGLIITDDMNQLHTSTKVSVKDALTRAYNSGIDIVLYVGAPESKQQIASTLVDLINNRQVDSAKIDASLTRILKAKRDLR